MLLESSKIDKVNIMILILLSIPPGRNCYDNGCVLKTMYAYFKHKHTHSDDYPQISDNANYARLF